MHRRSPPGVAEARVPGAWDASTPGVNRVWTGTRAGDKHHGGAGTEEGPPGGSRASFRHPQLCSSSSSLLLSAHACPLLCPLFSIFPFAGCVKPPLSGKCPGSARVCFLPA